MPTTALGEALGPVIILALAIALIRPWRALERAACRRLYGLTRDELRSGRTVLVRNRDGVLVPRPAATRPAARTGVTR